MILVGMFFWKQRLGCAKIFDIIFHETGSRLCLLRVLNIEVMKADCEWVGGGCVKNGSGAFKCSAGPHTWTYPL